MHLLAKKFWIIEDETQTKLGTIQVDTQRVKVNLGGGQYVYADFDSALREHDIVPSDEPIKESVASTASGTRARLALSC